MNRSKPLARRTPLRRSVLARKPPPRSGTVTHLDPARMEWKRARYGRCQCCGLLSDRPLHGHHIFERQCVARCGGDEWAPENRLDLCERCHLSHHGGLENRKLPMRIVPLRAVEWGVRTLGEDLAVLHLDRRYAKDALGEQG